jgi:hypothetical protein
MHLQNAWVSSRARARELELGWRHEWPCLLRGTNNSDAKKREQRRSLCAHRRSPSHSYRHPSSRPLAPVRGDTNLDLAPKKMRCLRKDAEGVPACSPGVEALRSALSARTQEGHLHGQSIGACNARQADNRRPVPPHPCYSARRTSKSPPRCPAASRDANSTCSNVSSLGRVRTERRWSSTLLPSRQPQAC